VVRLDSSSPDTLKYAIHPRKRVQTKRPFSLLASFSTFGCKEVLLSTDVLRWNAEEKGQARIHVTTNLPVTLENAPSIISVNPIIANDDITGLEISILYDGKALASVTSLEISGGYVGPENCGGESKTPYPERSETDYHLSMQLRGEKVVGQLGCEGGVVYPVTGEVHCFCDDVDVSARANVQVEVTRGGQRTIIIKDIRLSNVQENVPELVWKVPHPGCLNFSDHAFFHKIDWNVKLTFNNQLTLSARSRGRP
jgi:hypothetical protein